MAYSDINTVIANSLGVTESTAIFLLVVIGIWSLVWKGLALWKSAGKKHLVWFVVLLIFNTVGILEILYIYVFSKMNLGIKRRSNGGGNVSKKRVKKK